MRDIIKTSDYIQVFGDTPKVLQAFWLFITKSTQEISFTNMF